MDNRYFIHGCPALMQDGRFITNYTRNRVFNQFIREVNNIESSHEFRHFLQNNAETLINRERDYVNKMNTCNVNGQCLPVNNQ
jgi:hypothetical protein